MWVTILLVIGSAVLVISGFTWAARREALDSARALEALGLSPIAAVTEPRVVAVRARVGADEPLIDPVTDEEVAFYEAKVLRIDRGEKVLRTLEGGQVLRFEEGDVVARVKLENAQLDVEWEEREESENEPSPRIKKLLKAAAMDVPKADPASRYAIVHRAIPIGAEVTVIGRPRFEQGTPFFDAENGELIVSFATLDALKARERAQMRSMSIMLRIAVVVGALTVGVALVLLAFAP